jgi:hypothetical protein
MHYSSDICPPRDFTLMPFWFWNDRLDEREIIRQIDDFEQHGVLGFVIHPRIGLPRDIGWMSDTMLNFMGIAIEHAIKRDLRVMLYDEGMYPSGSSSGQVVLHDPTLACRCIAMLEASAPLPDNANVIARVPAADGRMITFIDRKANSYIRGLHYIDEGRNLEDEPPGGDILNPRTAQTVLRLVYDRFFKAFGPHFGKTIIGIFTDEPNPLAKCREPNFRPGTSGILQDVSSRLGYDFTPHLPALWLDEPDALRYRTDYDWAIHRRLEDTWYRPLSQWCQAHNVALCGHPDRGDEIGVQKFFHIPGQDLVWRSVVPGPSAIQGPESTQAKCSSSAMIHAGRRRNSNEFCGAYGHETTFDEFRWLANWCIVRGVNLLIPHAFYYSVRGPRKDERPPQVGGVGCAWWDQFKPFADHCRFLCWLNADSRHRCEVAVLAPPDHCPWRAAKVCFENQIDFNYVSADLLATEAIIDAAGIHVKEMSYGTLILDHYSNLPEHAQRLAPLVEAKRLIDYTDRSPGDGCVHASNAMELAAALRHRKLDRCAISPASTDLRLRRVQKDGADWRLFFNEGQRQISSELSLNGVASSDELCWVDTSTGITTNTTLPLGLELSPGELTLLRVRTGTRADRTL